MKKLSNLEIKPLFFIIFIFSILLIGATFAFMYTRGTFENKFKTSAYDIELSEEFDNDWGKKEVNILNKDTAPVVIRINYNELWTEKNSLYGEDILANNGLEKINSGNKSCRVQFYGNESNKYTLSNIINGEEVVTKNWTSTWADFIKGNDGWYYYNKILDANSSIQILESISLRQDLISLSNCYEDYNNYEYELSFNYEAIQADIKAIKDIWGYDISVSEGDVLWPF